VIRRSQQMASYSEKFLDDTMKRENTTSHNAAAGFAPDKFLA